MNTEKIANTVEAKFSYKPTDSNELGMRKGEHLIVLEDSDTWLRVQNKDGQSGFVPCNYVKRYKPGLFCTLRSTLRRRSSKRDALADDLKNHSSGPNGGTLDMQRTRHGSFESFTDQFERLKLSSGDAHPTGSLKKTPFASSFPPVSSVEDVPRNHYSVPEGANPRSPTVHLHQSAPSSSNNGHMQVRQNGYSIADISPPGTTHPGTDQMACFDAGSTVGRHLCQALFTYQARQADELTIQRGDKIHVLEKSSDGWWRGTLVTDALPAPTGWFPSNYVTLDLAKNLNRSGSTSQPSNLNSPIRPTATSTQVPSQPPIPTSIEFDPSGVGLSLRNNSIAPDPSKPKEVVVTLYPFARNQLEELSFEPNEILIVIDKPPDDPDWWQCRNARGETGLVPRNYVRSVPESVLNTTTPSAPSVNQISTTRMPSSYPQGFEDRTIPSSVRREYALRSATSKAYADQPWCWGSISRSECETLLSQYAQPGEFIVRDSESHPGDLTITIHAGNKTRNFKVRVEGGQYFIGQKVFPSVQDLIDHYRCHPIFKNDQEKHYLTRPFVHPADAKDPRRPLNNFTLPARACTTNVPPVQYS